jgi:hypothetical protein
MMGRFNICIPEENRMGERKNSYRILVKNMKERRYVRNKGIVEVQG